MLQVYSKSMAMLLTMVLWVYLFNFKPTVQVKFHAIRSHMILKVRFKPFSLTCIIDYSTHHSFSWVLSSAWCHYTFILHSKHAYRYAFNHENISRVSCHKKWTKNRFLIYLRPRKLCCYSKLVKHRYGISRFFLTVGPRLSNSMNHSTWSVG